jgi:hypothetical protein
MALEAVLAEKAQGREVPAAQVATQGQERAQEVQQDQEVVPAPEQWAGLAAVLGRDRQAEVLVVAVGPEPLGAARAADRRAPELGAARAVDRRALELGAARAVEPLVAKALTLVQNQAAEPCSAARQQVHLAAGAHAEAVLAALDPVALVAQPQSVGADQTTREAACQVGARKTKTSSEF